MNKLLNKKVVTSWRKMPIEDKILLIMESICYFLTSGTLIATIYAIKVGYITASIVLLFSIIGFIKCGLSARSSRESFLYEWKFNLKSNDKRIVSELRAEISK